MSNGEGAPEQELARDLGFVKSAAVAEEIKDPAKNLPRTLIGSVALVTLLYVVILLRMKEKIKDAGPPFACVSDFRRTPVVEGTAVGSEPVCSGIGCRFGIGRCKIARDRNGFFSQIGLQPSPYRRLLRGSRV